MLNLMLNICWLWRYLNDWKYWLVFYSWYISISVKCLIKFNYPLLTTRLVAKLPHQLLACLNQIIVVSLKLLMMRIQFHLLLRDRIQSFVSTLHFILLLIFLFNLLYSQCIFLLDCYSALSLQSRQHFCSFVLYVFTFALLRQIEHAKCISQYLRLNPKIEGTVCAKTWCLINFNQPWLCFLVNENIEAEHLETEVRLKVLWFNCSVGVSYLLMTSDYCFYC